MDKATRIRIALEDTRLVEAIQSLTFLLAEAAASVEDNDDPAFNDALVPEANAAINECVYKFIAE